MSDEKAKNPVNEVVLRSYPKVIFFYPLLFTTLILWIIQAVMGTPNPTLGQVWFIMFFVNMFIIAFDFSSTKFFILVLAIVVVLLLVVFLVDWSSISGGVGISLNIALPVDFYMVMSAVLGFILLFVIIGNQFSYYKVERNEIYYKRGLAGSAERFPVKSLRIHKEIPDIFEYLALRAGSITLIPSKDKVIMLNTVLNVNKKADQIDELLSRIRVEIDDHA
jgi:hypothetical protein